MTTTSVPVSLTEPVSLIDLPVDSVQQNSDYAIRVIDYTAKSCVVIGDTFKYKNILKQSGGRWTPRLLQLPGIADKGWIFPITKKTEIERLIANLSDGSSSSSSSVGSSSSSSLISPMPETRVPTPIISLKSLSPIGVASSGSIVASGGASVNEVGELISYNKSTDKRDDHTTDITVTKIEDFIREGKKVRVTTTIVTRTEELS